MRVDVECDVRASDARSARVNEPSGPEASSGQAPTSGSRQTACELLVAAAPAPSGPDASTAPTPGSRQTAWELRIVAAPAPSRPEASTAPTSGSRQTACELLVTAAPAPSGANDTAATMGAVKLRRRSGVQIAAMPPALMVATPYVPRRLQDNCAATPGVSQSVPDHLIWVVR